MNTVCNPGSRPSSLCPSSVVDGSLRSSRADSTATTPLLVKKFFLAACCSLLTALALPVGAAHAQGSPGSLDTTFDPGSGPNGTVNAVVVQRADGKVIAGGAFLRISGTRRPGVARFLPNGSLDTSFDPGDGASDGEVRALALQADGKILVGGRFRTFNGSPRAGLARLNADGSLDATFQPFTGLSGRTNALALQTNGKILVGGRYLNNADDSQSFSVTRLNTDGSFDTAFTGAGNHGVTTDGYVYALAVGADGRIVFGGDFFAVNVVSGRGGVGRPGLARLNAADGSVDSSFVPDKFDLDIIYSVALQADGKVLYASTTFVQFFAPPSRQVAGVFRLNADGSRDAAFLSLGYYDGDFYAVTLQPDGKILYGGDGIRSNGVGDVGRLNATDGRLDSTFFSDVRARPTYTLALQPADGRIVIGGDFISVNGTSRTALARLNNDAGGASSFFTGAVSVGSGFKYLVFPNGTLFGYYNDAAFPFIYHDDLGFEYVIDAGNAARGVYLYDFKLGVFFYTDPQIFPYLYNFGTNSFFYYFPDTNRPGHYTTNPRVFYNFGNGQFVFSP